MKISLRLRFALLTASLLILCCAALLCITGYSNNMMLSNIKDVTTSTTPNLPYAPLKAFDDQHNLNQTRLFWGFMTVIVLGTLTSYWVAGIALKPLRTLTEEIKTITDKNLHTTLNTPKVHDEIFGLATSFNEMLRRLEIAFQKEKRFSASVAHELKTPLTILRTKYEVFEMSPTHSLADYEKVLGVSKENVERLVKIVDCLLTLQTTTSPLNLQKVNLSQLIVDLVATLTPLAQQAQLNFHLDLHPLMILAHRDLLYRALFNLIENAIKYNHPNGDISISCKLQQQQVVIRIQDTGIGIPAESIPLLFDAFYRVDPSRSRKIGGSGLGLTLVSEIITLHNGTIDVESDGAKGSTFSIFIPL